MPTPNLTYLNYYDAVDAEGNYYHNRQGKWIMNDNPKLPIRNQDPWAGRVQPGGPGGGSGGDSFASPGGQGENPYGLPITPGPPQIPVTGNVPVGIGTPPPAPGSATPSSSSSSSDAVLQQILKSLTGGSGANPYILAALQGGLGIAGGLLAGDDSQPSTKETFAGTGSTDPRVSLARMFRGTENVGDALMRRSANPVTLQPPDVKGAPPTTVPGVPFTFGEGMQSTQRREPYPGLDFGGASSLFGDDEEDPMNPAAPKPTAQRRTL